MFLAFCRFLIIFRWENFSDQVPKLDIYIYAHVELEIFIVPMRKNSTLNDAY